MPDMPDKHSKENRIPDYSHLFGDEAREPKKASVILWDMTKGYRGKILLSTLFYVIKALPVWVMPVLTASIINIASQPLTDSSYGMIGLYSGLLAIILVENVPMHMVYAKIVNTMMRSVNAGLRSALVRKLQRLSITYHKQIASGKLQMKFLRDTDAVSGLLSTVITTVIPAVIGVLISIGISLTHSVPMTLFFIVIVPANILLTRFFAAKMRSRNSDVRIESENVSAAFSSMLHMLPVTKAHGLENREIDSFESHVDLLTKKGLSADRTVAHFGSWVWVIGNALSGLCLVVCAILALRGHIPVGDIVLYQSLFSQINGNVTTLINIFPTLVSGVESVRSVAEVMTSDDVERGGAWHLKNIRGQIDFDHVSYSYPDKPDHYVIKDLDLHIKEGECIAFVGASGSGKSTVMNMIIGFLTATEGAVRVDGKDLRDVQLSRYRHHISVVPQNSILFQGSLRDNITYGLDRYSEEDLARVVEMANITEFLPTLPDGLDSDVGENGDKLSGGQRQRVTIARALIRDPAILILDEATSALDNISEYNVQKAIDSLVRGRTTFIVAHRLSTIRNADRIVVMEDGRAVEIGTYEELCAKNGKFSALKALNDMTVISS